MWRAAHLLADVRAPWCVALLAASLTVLAWPSGYQLDDVYHRMILRNELTLGNGNPLLDLFTFSRGDVARNQADMATGFAPWWTSPGYRMNFFRPLAAATHWVDHHAWPNQIWLMHAQCSVWFAAAVVAIGYLFRRLFSHAQDAEPLRPPHFLRISLPAQWSAMAAAGLATLVYALRDEHAIAIAWIANRNLLMGTFFGAVAWTCHSQWREMGSRRAAIAAPVFFSLALLSGEAAATIGGCLAAYALVLDRAAWRGKLLSLLPCGLVGMLWFACYQMLHCGARESGLYLDPKHDLIAYCLGFLQRAPVYIASSFGVSSALGLSFDPPFMQRILVVEAIVCVTAIAVVLFPAIRRDRLMQFFALCLVPAIFPLCAGLATDRLMMIFNIPASGLLARFVQLTLNQVRLSRSPQWRTSADWFAGGAILLNTVAAAGLMVLGIAGFGKYGEAFQTAVHSPVFDRPHFASEDLIMVNAPDALYPLYIPYARHAQGLSRPQVTRMLATSMTSFHVTRTDDRTLEYFIPGGLIADVFSKMYRNAEQYPLRAGTHIELPRMSVTVLEHAADGQPTRIAYRFAVPLEDPSLCLVEWRDGRFVRFVPPPLQDSRAVAQASWWKMYHIEPMQKAIGL